MEAKLKKIAVTPAHFNKDGDIDREEFCTLTLDVPIDTKSAREWVAGLLGLTSRHFVEVDIDSPQVPIDEVKKQTVEMDRAKIDAQLEVAT